MSLIDAKRMLQWNVVMEALAAAEVDAETVAMVESAKAAGDVTNGFARMLLGGADTNQAKNYVKVEMTGMAVPFDRAYVELVRPGGKTSHELRELLRECLVHVKKCLTSDQINDEAFRRGMLERLNETLMLEST